MPSFIFTDKAEEDLAKIVDFTLERWGIEKAHQYIDGLDEIAQMLADNPDVGIDRKGLFSGLYCFPYESHMIFYVKHAQSIAIIRVLHENMEVENHIK